MLGSGSVSGISGQGGQVVDLGTGYLLTFKRRVKLYDANPDKYRFYAPYILLEGLNHRIAGPFKDEVKAIQAILKDEIRSCGRYHAYLDHIINMQFDPLAEFDEKTARYHLKLIRNLLIESRGDDDA